VTFIEKTINNVQSSEKITQFIQETQPKMMVFLGNKPLQAYAHYQKNKAQYSGSDQSFPPGLALSALHVDQQLKTLKNTSGIRYEIPAVTSLVQLRSLVKQPVKKVGVIYRQWMSDFVLQNQIWCQQEEIELVMIELANNTSVSQLKFQLKHLLRKDIDALWVVNDNALLRPRSIQNVWIPLLKKFDKPVLVGINALANTRLNFGTFSVQADPYALGLQGAEMISDIMGNNWQIAEYEVELPLSIKNLLNVKLSENKNIILDRQKFEEIDQLIQ
jgi:putative ABC transport system substrate-binding protein